MVQPHKDDVVVREKRGNPTTFYALSRPFALDQVKVSTHDEAIAAAVAFARHEHVRAWFERDNGDFVLLGTFRADDVKPTGLA